MAKNRKGTFTSPGKLKTKRERQSYWKGLTKPINPSDPTIPVKYENLVGSNEYSILDESDSIQHDPIAPIPPIIQLKRFAYDHIVGIILTILTTMAFGIGAKVISIQDDVVRIDEKLNSLSEKVQVLKEDHEALSNDTFSISEIETQIELSKQEIENGFLLDISDVENRIEIIDLKIEEISSESESTSNK